MHMPWPERSIDGLVSSEVLGSIHGRELLIQHLGHWPTFHDFEVISISLERAPWLTTATCDLRAIFYVYDLQQPPAEPERKQAFAELLFEHIDELQIAGFNHQNPIMGLSITRRESSGASPSLFVEWGGTCLQHEVSFSCSRISVVRVIDLNPFQQSISTQ
jgi:Immunity protein 50